jgi:hypothetical protein
MNRCALIAFALTAVVSDFLGRPHSGRADLFAVAASNNQILRLNSATLEVTHTYDNPDGPIGGSSTMGVAFDGRILSWTRGFGGGIVQELHQFDVVNETWAPPFQMFDIIAPYQIAGLATLGPDSGGDVLGIATAPLGLQLPSMFYRISPPGFAIPLGELPVNYNPVGLDIDPVTGETWVVARNLDVTPLTFELLRVHVPGAQPTLAALSEATVETPQPVTAGPTIEQAIRLAFAPGAPVRGLAFENGGMYVVAANRTLAEVNPTDGTILRSLVFPGPNTIGGLAGGTVVPEPSAAILLALAAAAVVRRHRRSRGNWQE